MELGKNFSKFIVNETLLEADPEFDGRASNGNRAIYMGRKIRVKGTYCPKHSGNGVEIIPILIGQLITNDPNDCIRPLEHLKVKRSYEET